MHDITYWGEASMRARAVPEGRPVRCGELKKGIFGPGSGYKKRHPSRWNTRSYYSEKIAVPCCFVFHVEARLNWTPRATS